MICLRNCIADALAQLLRAANRRLLRLTIISAAATLSIGLTVLWGVAAAHELDPSKAPSMRTPMGALASGDWKLIRSRWATAICFDPRRFESHQFKILASPLNVSAYKEMKVGGRSDEGPKPLPSWFSRRVESFATAVPLPEFSVGPNRDTVLVVTQYDPYAPLYWRAEAYGWPFRSSFLFRELYRPSQEFVLRHGIPVTSHADRSYADGTKLGGGYAIPTGVLWGGAIGNCIFWIVVFALPFVLGAAKRAVRKMRGRCAACGYSLQSLSTLRCPECGIQFGDAPGRPNGANS
jgi:hypothetical protein